MENEPWQDVKAATPRGARRRAALLGAAIGAAVLLLGEVLALPEWLLAVAAAVADG